MTAAEKERAKYEGIFKAGGHYKGYGHSNHGKGALKHVVDIMKSASVVDIGCGWNEFTKMVKEKNPKIVTSGVDFACPGADIVCSAENLPFEDKQWDTLTAFDMLEHILEEQAVPILREFARVSKRFVFSISYVPSVIKWKEENLHPCVHSEDWWIMKIMHVGGENIKKVGRYITGTWGSPLVMAPDTNIILVGNGPGILRCDGAKIDAFDEVVRFNTYHTEPEYAPHTGTKTTIWSTFGKGQLPAVEERPERVIYIHGETGGPSYEAKTVYKIPRWYFGYVSSATKSLGAYLKGLAGDPARVGKERDTITSSGLLVASWLLQVVGVKKLVLAGFDHFGKKESKLHHYYINKPYGTPREHNAEAEAMLFAGLRDSGRVEYLTP